MRYDLLLTHFRLSDSEKELLLLGGLGSWEICLQKVLKSVWYLILSNSLNVLKSLFGCLEWLEGSKFDHLRESL
jgi:hypothetical protein